MRDAAARIVLIRKRCDNRRNQRLHKIAVLGGDRDAQPTPLQFSGNDRTDGGDGSLLQHRSQGFFPTRRDSDFEQPPDLWGTGERNHIDSALRHPIDQPDHLFVIGCGRIDIRQNRIGLRACASQEIGKLRIGHIRVELNPDPASAQIMGR